SIATRPGSHGHRRLCRLRTLRRKRARGDALPVVLSRRSRAQSNFARTCARSPTCGRAQVAAGGVTMSEAPTAIRNVNPITLLVCALGGEGGGVLAEWLVEAATHAGYAAQSTSIPGVAQRTGATTYYVEVFPEP